MCLASHDCHRTGETSTPDTGGGPLSHSRRTRPGSGRSARPGRTPSSPARPDHRRRPPATPRRTTLDTTATNRRLSHPARRRPRRGHPPHWHTRAPRADPGLPAAAAGVPALPPARHRRPRSQPAPTAAAAGSCPDSLPRRPSRTTAAWGAPPRTAVRLRRTELSSTPATCADTRRPPLPPATRAPRHRPPVTDHRNSHPAGTHRSRHHAPAGPAPSHLHHSRMVRTALPQHRQDRPPGRLRVRLGHPQRCGTTPANTASRSAAPHRRPTRSPPGRPTTCPRPPSSPPAQAATASTTSATSFRCPATAPNAPSPRTPRHRPHATPPAHRTRRGHPHLPTRHPARPHTRGQAVPPPGRQGDPSAASTNNTTTNTGRTTKPHPYRRTHPAPIAQDRSTIPTGGVLDQPRTDTTARSALLMIFRILQAPL